MLKRYKNILIFLKNTFVKKTNSCMSVTPDSLAHVFKPSNHLLGRILWVHLPYQSFERNYLNFTSYVFYKLREKIF